ncbi:hypothetical protein KQ246_07060 [Pseudoalteromonas shioyasakiensis]|nr:hypothetical protein KQ246_07060 [Pseudoalteromonas shioyasakiensis]
MRYSAHKLTAEDFAEQDLKIKSGEYRGREVLLKTSIIEGQLTATGSSRNIYITDSNLGDLVTTGTKFYVVSSDGTVQSSRVGTVGVTGFISDDTLNNLETVTHVIVSRYEKLSISGEFTHTEVIGDPANILLCDDLKDGWIGSWNQAIPNNQTTKVSWDRPVVEAPSSGAVLYTLNSGASWGVGSSTIWLPVNSENESATVELTAGMIVIASYKTKARMTTPSTVSEIHGAISDVNYLFTSMDASDAKGRLLNFSLTGLIQTHAASATKIGLETIRLESLPLLPATGKFWGFNASAGELRHSPLSLDAPTNDSPAFKAVNYNVAKNQQGFINYAYAQLTYDATAGDWGDDGKIHPVDNQATMLDEKRPH